jgi:hypothetical protein
MTTDKDRGGDINITNNFNAPIGQHIDHVDTINFRMDGDGTFHFGMVEKASVTEEVSEQLRSERAERLKERLTDAGMLSDDWQPAGLSNTEKALLAKAVSDRLGIKEVWQVFGRLWNVKPDSMRAYFNRALEQKKSLSFQDRIKVAID